MPRRFRVDDWVRLKNATSIMETLEREGGNSKTQTLLRTFNSTGGKGPLLDTMIEAGLINMKFMGRAKWITLLPKGRAVLQAWRRFIDAWNVEEPEAGESGSALAP